MGTQSEYQVEKSGTLHNLAELQKSAAPIVVPSELPAWLGQRGSWLTLDGVEAKTLVETYGTPLFVYSENAILQQLNVIKSEFLHRYANTHAAYACKAFCSQYMCRLLDREGFWIDVVSGGELFTALSSGFPAHRIEFNGNNKTQQELRMALEAGVGRFVIDAVTELYEISELVGALNLPPAKVLFRITPNVESDTHDYITTGKKDSKFGIVLEDGILMPLIEDAIKLPTIDFLGFHFHVGSQLMEPKSHVKALETVLPLLKKTYTQFGYEVKDLNLGGGFGIRYTGEDQPMPLSAFIDPLMESLEKYCEAQGLSRPHVSIEPGRSIVGEAGVQLYTVGTIKEIPGIKTYINVDGGMTDNIRPGLYGAKYYGLLANKMDWPIDCTVDISGKCCESTDILIRQLPLAKAASGDTLAVLSTGAYGYAMASNYNKLLLPAVVVVVDGTHFPMIRRQSYGDLLALEV